MINSLNLNNKTNTINNYKNVEIKKELKQETNLKENQNNVPMDKLELSGSKIEKKFNYSNVDNAKLNKLTEESDKKVSEFKQLITSMLEKQVIGTKKVITSANKEIEMVEFNIDEKTKAELKFNVSDEGFYGAENTANRILDFAKGLMNGDNSKLDMLKKAFIDGFNEAKEMFGGELPEVSNKTYELVMKGFEELEKSSNNNSV